MRKKEQQNIHNIRLQRLPVSLLYFYFHLFSIKLSAVCFHVMIFFFLLNCCFFKLISLLFNRASLYAETELGSLEVFFCIVKMLLMNFWIFYLKTLAKLFFFHSRRSAKILTKPLNAEKNDERKKNHIHGDKCQSVK